MTSGWPKNASRAIPVWFGMVWFGKILPRRGYPGVPKYEISYLGCFKVYIISGHIFKHRQLVSSPNLSISSLLEYVFSQISHALRVVKTEIAFWGLIRVYIINTHKVMTKQPISSLQVPISSLLEGYFCRTGHGIRSLVGMGGWNHVSRPGKVIYHQSSQSYDQPAHFQPLSTHFQPSGRVFLPNRPCFWGKIMFLGLKS